MFVVQVGWRTSVGVIIVDMRNGFIVGE